MENKTQQDRKEYRRANTWNYQNKNTVALASAQCWQIIW